MRGIIFILCKSLEVFYEAAVITLVEINFGHLFFESAFSPIRVRFSSSYLAEMNPRIESDIFMLKVVYAENFMMFGSHSGRELQRFENIVKRKFHTN
jgi:hypothetical protein